MLLVSSTNYFFRAHKSYANSQEPIIFMCSLIPNQPVLRIRSDETPQMHWPHQLYHTCVTNFIQMIFKYNLRFVTFSLLLGHNFVCGICKLKSKNLEKL